MWSPLTFSDTDSALHWLETERRNYLAVIEYAAVNGPFRYTWQITDAARPDVQLRYRPDELERAATLGLTCARAERDRRGEAVMLLVLGALKSITSRLTESLVDFVESRRIAEELDERGLLTSVLLSAAAMCGVAGNIRDCVRYAEKAHVLVEQGVEQGERRRLAVSNILGTAYLYLGRLDEASVLFRQAKELASKASLISRAGVEGDLGLVHLAMGNADQALTRFASSLDMARGRLADEEWTIGMARAHCQLGAVDRALELATAVFEKTQRQDNTRYEAECRIVIGAIHLSAGRTDLALDFYRTGYDMACRNEMNILEIEALIGIALAGRDVEAARRAVELARTHGIRLYEADALNALADVMLEAGDVAAARAAAEEALGMHRTSGARSGEDKALELLRRMRAEPGGVV